MDFITSLPKSDGYGMIMVMVERFSKYPTFMPAIAGCTTKEASQFLFKNVMNIRGCRDISLVTETPALTGTFRGSYLRY